MIGTSIEGSEEGRQETGQSKKWQEMRNMKSYGKSSARDATKVFRKPAHVNYENNWVRQFSVRQACYYLVEGGETGTAAPAEPHARVSIDSGPGCFINPSVNRHCLTAMDPRT